MERYGEAVEQFAHKQHLEVHRSPFHASEGLELRKVEGEYFKCVGYIVGPEETLIYRIVRNRWHTFAGSTLWFLYGWLIRRPKEPSPLVTLSTIRSADFREEDFLDLVKKELLAD